MHSRLYSPLFVLITASLRSSFFVLHRGAAQCLWRGLRPRVHLRLYSPLFVLITASLRSSFFVLHRGAAQCLWLSDHRHGPCKDKRRPAGSC
ncbi:hypothetical protein [Gordonia oryzae]|uniref:hypothetical protein n=1 Tax=Gordonia oryzae TaxID=2487349 RepID=UPI003F84C1CA